ncbi:MAG TPA: S1/P1 nuclease [Xanthobacteraceae bacterium]|nr:S1/P1 nuclease [Xanthobacteraceae bacterium]
MGDIHQPLHVGAAYYDQDCENLVDPNVVGAGKPDFGIGTTVVATTGGNDFHIGSSKNLHAYWDDSAVIGAMRLKGITDKSAQNFAQAIVNAPPRSWRTAGDVDAWSAQWASEVLPIADQAIADAEIGEVTSHTESNAGLKCTWSATVDRNYSKWANQQALTQLGKAGFRLAALLQAIFEKP